MKNKLLSILLIGIFAIGLTGCGKEDKTVADAKILNWDQILKETDGNAALAEDYENRSYVFMGRVQKIETDSCNLSGFIVELEKEELKKLKVGETIVVIGVLKDSTTHPKLASAIRLDKQTVEDNYLIALTKKSTFGDKMQVALTYKYSDYTFDKNKQLVTSYIETNETYTDEKPKTYTIKYDEKGNILEKDDYVYSYNSDGTLLQEKMKSGGTTTVYNYSYEKDSKDRIIKKIKKSKNGDLTTYTYEYDDNDNVIKETVEDSNDKWYYELEYNNNNQLIKKSWKKNNSTLENSLEYEYDEFGNIIKEVEINQRMTNESYGLLIHDDKKTTNYYYGIVGKK